MKTTLVLALALLAAPASAKAAVLPFSLDPPLSVFSGSLGVAASASYLETVADGSPCWWLFVDAYNADQPAPTPLAYEPLPPAAYTPPPVWTLPDQGSVPAPVPEPATWLLALVGFASLLLRRRFTCSALR